MKLVSMYILGGSQGLQAFAVTAQVTHFTCNLWVRRGYVRWGLAVAT